MKQQCVTFFESTKRDHLVLEEEQESHIPTWKQHTQETVWTLQKLSLWEILDIS
jgi:hypothetical protein